MMERLLDYTIIVPQSWAVTFKMALSSALEATIALLIIVVVVTVVVVVVSVVVVVITVFVVVVATVVVVVVVVLLHLGGQGPSDCNLTSSKTRFAEIGFLDYWANTSVPLDFKIPNPVSIFLITPWAVLVFISHHFLQCCPGHWHEMLQSSSGLNMGISTINSFFSKPSSGVEIPQCLFEVPKGLLFKEFEYEAFASFLGWPCPETIAIGAIP
ncbi:hypothetical protein Tco_0548487 [Tanacetum coccineum]